MWKGPKGGDQVLSNGARAAEIIDHLRSFYKKDVQPQREVVDVNELVGEMLVLLEREATRTRSVDPHRPGRGSVDGHGRPRSCSRS